jgi:hypothetical protein
MSGDIDGLREYVTSRLPSLRRSAFLMCGDWELATELSEACLARVVDGTRRGAVADADVYVYADLMEACRRRNRRREHVFVAGAVLVLRHWDGFAVDAVGAMLDLDDERVDAYERAGLAALEQLLANSQTALTR